MKCKTLVLGILILGIGAFGDSGQAAAPLASTPSGRRVQAYLKAFNAGEAAVKEFFAANTATDSLHGPPDPVLAASVSAGRPALRPVPRS